MVAFFLLAVVTVMVALPSVSAVTRPSASTSAALGLLLFHVSTVRAVSGASTASSWRSSPTSTVAALPWSRLTPVGL